MGNCEHTESHNLVHQSILLRSASLKQRNRRAKCAIINIRLPGDYEGTDIDAVQEACNQLGWSLADADRNGIEHSDSEVDVILDIGDFGWEPSLYVLGTSPLEVVDRIHTLVKTLEGTA